MTAPPTGRPPSAPRLQNIPVPTAAGLDLRALFVAPPGVVPLAADYSRIELRVLALAERPTMADTTPPRANTARLYDDDGFCRLCSAAPGAAHTTDCHGEVLPAVERALATQTATADALRAGLAAASASPDRGIALLNLMDGSEVPPTPAQLDAHTGAWLVAFDANLRLVYGADARRLAAVPVGTPHGPRRWWALTDRGYLTPVYVPPPAAPGV